MVIPTMRSSYYFQFAHLLNVFKLSDQNTLLVKEIGRPLLHYHKPSTCLGCNLYHDMTFQWRNPATSIMNLYENSLHEIGLLVYIKPESLCKYGDKFSDGSLMRISIIVHPILLCESIGLPALLNDGIPFECLLISKYNLTRSMRSNQLCKTNLQTNARFLYLLLPKRLSRTYLALLWGVSTITLS